MENGVGKILVVTERFPPLTGGMAVSAARQVTGLRERGFETDVLLFTATDGDTAVTRRERDGGTDYIVSHPDAPGNASQRAWREILSVHARKNYTFVIGFGAGFPGYVAVTYAAWLNVPSMVSVRGNDFDRDWFEPKKSAFVREALGRADLVATVSTEKKEKIEALFPGKSVFWAPNGIDSSLYELLPGEKEKAEELRTELDGNVRRIVGLFGELKYKKRIPMWLSAVREHNLNDRLSLLVTGKTDARTHAVLSDPYLSPPSRHISFRSQNELAPLYAACDFIAIPSLFEGFPNVLLEAMAAGVIPIVSDAGAMKDIVRHGETGFLFPAENRTLAGEATKEALMLSDTEILTMKQNIRSFVAERFTIENEMDVLVKNIRKAVSNRPCT